LFRPQETDTRKIVFWDLATDQEWTRIPGGNTIRFAPDGKRFAILDGGGQEHQEFDRLHVAIWELPEDHSLPRLLKRQQIVVGEATYWSIFLFMFSPDLQTCAIGCPHDDAKREYEIALWDLSTNEEQAPLLQRHTELGGLHYDEDQAEKGDSCMEYSPGGHYVMATMDGGEYKEGVLWVSHLKVVIVDAQGELQGVHISHGVPQISHCGRWILSPDGSGAGVWEVGTQRKHVDLRHATDHDPGWPILSMPGGTTPRARYQFSSDGRFVMVTGFETTTTPNPMEMMLTRQWSRINKPETISVGRLWNVEHGEEVAVFPDCDVAQFTPDGRTLVTKAWGSNELKFWTVPPRRPVGLILALTTATWSLVLGIGWLAKRRLRRRLRSSTL
jgi:hypothetical protein